MKTGPLRGFNAGNPKHLRKLDSVSGGAHHRPEAVDPDTIGLRNIKLGLLCRNAQHQSCIILQYGAQVTCCSYLLHMAATPSAKAFQANGRWRLALDCQALIVGHVHVSFRPDQPDATPQAELWCAADGSSVERERRPSDGFHIPYT